MISLEMTHAELGWPPPNEIRSPTGAGPGVFAQLARDKIGVVLERSRDAREASVGVLMPDSRAATSEPPLGIVIEFPRHAGDKTLRELLRLSWNFSHSPAVVTIEPDLLRIWTCCEPPNPNRPLSAFLVHELGEPEPQEAKRPTLELQAARALHWINLVSGEFFREHAHRFSRHGRADQMLMANLQDIRDKLSETGLRDDDICHDLLARVVFVQFLFDRKDSDGKPALTPAKMAYLHEQGVLHRPHENFASVLADYEDAYHLFDWLNARFNGDLFPGKGDTKAERAEGWQAERRVVTSRHTSLLADFVRGDLHMPSGQACLWPQYAFDVIPLEFISSIYETFVKKRAAQQGIVYTPPYLVDFVLDRVLPWDDVSWDLRILDPSCGSGIFLVKAFQRLVHRWKLAHPGKQIRAETLRRLLERNLFGVDKDPHAVRVACFSLYLAMCDEIDPRYYWTQVAFPPLRERRLVCADFFTEDQPGVATVADAGTYDLVVGNAPWGTESLTNPGRRWAAEYEWSVANKGIGTLFLPKAAQLTRAGGAVAMIQSASSLLFNRSGPATAFRQRFFNSFRVVEIVNLSAMRFQVFKRVGRRPRSSVAPICVVTLYSERPHADDRISYISPKHLEESTGEFKIIIEPLDRRWLTVDDAAYDPVAWTSLMWGSPRDRALIKRLQVQPSLAAPQPRYEVKRREGIIFGDRRKFQWQLSERRILDTKTFPPGSLLHFDADALPILADVRTDSKASTDFTAFALPQLIIKQSWQKDVSRFQARLAHSEEGKGALCTQSYITVHGPRILLEAACLAVNSMLATYFLLLTSGRFASYRPEPLVDELLAVPVPTPRPGMLQGVNDESDVDHRVFEAFEFKDAERALIEDLFNYTLPDFKGDSTSPGRQRTVRTETGKDEPQLVAYCEYFVRVLKAGFGHDKGITATIFQEPFGHLPYRLVAFELGRAADEQIAVRRVDAPELIRKLEQLNVRWRERRPNGGLYSERLARVYDSSSGVPTVFVVKPDMIRYWTRSAGLGDADEVALDLFRWHQAAKRAEVAH